jgi:general secretion pathway protein G
MRNKEQKYTSQTGFTLIELLVVISILGLLASLISLRAYELRSRARDAVRKDDSLTLRTALQWYYHENGEYPKRGALGNPNNETDIHGLAGFLVPKYMNKIPNDPRSNIENYQYVWKNDGADYGLYIPFSNDGGVSCQFKTQGGSDNWFNKAFPCTF